MVMSTHTRIELDDPQSWSALVEEIIVQLARLKRCLVEDRVEDAKQVVRHNFGERIDDYLEQSALAIAFFKLGLHTRALSVYRRLIDAHPDDAVLRLNIAIVFLKVGLTEEAEEQLVQATQLEPDYRKALGYLGFTYQRRGDYAGASEAFKKARIDHLAPRMADTISQALTDESATLETGDATTMNERPTLVSAPGQERLGERGGGIHSLSVGAPLTVGRSEQHVFEPTPIADLADRTRLIEPLSSRFLVGSNGYLMMDVVDRGYARLEGLHFCSSTGLAYKPARRRQRGQTLDSLLGDDKKPIFEIEGTGRLGFHPRGAMFTAISLNDDVAYIREDLVFAFDSQISFENGKTPGGNEQVVHFHGRGAIVLQTAITPQSLEITPDRGAVIPAGGLVGWFGRLLPRAAHGGPFDRSLNAIEVTGEGVLLFCLS